MSVDFTAIQRFVELVAQLLVWFAKIKAVYLAFRFDRPTSK